MDKLKKEAIEILRDCDEVKLITKDDEWIDISLAENYLGGEGFDGYICDYLGSVVYSTPERVVNAIFDYIDSIDDKIIEVDY